MLPRALFADMRSHDSSGSGSGGAQAEAEAAERRGGDGDTVAKAPSLGEGIPSLSSPLWRQWQTLRRTAPHHTHDHHLAT